MLDVFLTGSVAFIITFLAIPVILQIAELKKLYDLPDDRKIHARPVASLGGVGIFAGFYLLHYCQFLNTLILNFNTFLLQGLLFFFRSQDDLIVLSAFKKIIGQVCGFYSLHLAGIKLTSLHGLFGIYGA